MAEAVTIQVDGSNTPQELRDLIDRAMADKPAKKDLAELRKYIDFNPGLLSETISLAKVTQQAIIEKVATQPAIKLVVKDDVYMLERGLGMDQAPMIEKLIIQNIVNNWLRLQWVEYQVTGNMGEGVSREQVGWWEKRLSITQGRYLRALETLARVRRMALPDLQVNIAKDGGQQINVAGDIKR